MRLLKILFPLVALGLVVYVLHVSITNNGGWGATFDTTSLPAFIARLQRLAGLVAFLFVSFQVITGPYMTLWQKLYGPSFYRYHGYQGIFALVFALTHWLLADLYLWVSHTGFIEFHKINFPLPEFFEFYFGPLALIIMGCTVVTAAVAVLWEKPLFQKIWRKLHYANYLVFLLVYLHSRKIGTDVGVPGSSLRVIWDIFFVGTFGGLVYRHIWQPLAQKRPHSVLESHS